MSPTSAPRLERSYRRALRWYPRAWREANGDVVIGTLLDVSDAEGRTSPRASEIAALVLRGTLLRATTALPRGVRDRTASVAMGMGAALALVFTFHLEVLAWRSAEILPMFGPVVTFGPFLSPTIFVYALWLIAFIFAMVGRTAAARVAVIATLPLALVTRVVSDAFAMWGRPTWTTLSVLCILAILAAIGRPALSPRAAGVTAIAFAMSLGVLVSTFLLQGGEPLRDPRFFGGTIGTWVGWAPFVAVGVAVVLVIARQRQWAAASLILALPWIAHEVFGNKDPGELLTTSLLLTLVIGAVSALAALLRFAGVRVTLTPRH